MCLSFQNQRDQNYTVLKTKGHMMTVEGLKPGTTYVFRVRARTDGGYGNYGGEIELETSHEGTVIDLISVFILAVCILYLRSRHVSFLVFNVFSIFTPLFFDFHQLWTVNVGGPQRIVMSCINFLLIINPIRYILSQRNIVVMLCWAFLSFW